MQLAHPHCPSQQEGTKNACIHRHIGQGTGADEAGKQEEDEAVIAAWDHHESKGHEAPAHQGPDTAAQAGRF
ncbi:hypothetical protein AEM38_15510 [Hyphomonadaceae bacterium UKL13-1]|nr:hypothetical protein AEM38_15510 [Hyphomonadaceae bacterium UKL13-1]